MNCCAHATRPPWSTPLTSAFIHAEQLTERNSGVIFPAIPLGKKKKQTLLCQCDSPGLCRKVQQLIPEEFWFFSSECLMLFWQHRLIGNPWRMLSPGGHISDLQERMAVPALPTSKSSASFYSLRLGCFSQNPSPGEPSCLLLPESEQNTHCYHIFELLSLKRQSVRDFQSILSNLDESQRARSQTIPNPWPRLLFWQSAFSFRRKFWSTFIVLLHCEINP